MINWLYEWIYGSTVYAPARNAPNEGHDVKKFIESKPPEISLISSDEINHVIQKLNKVPEIEKPVIRGTPLMEEFNSVFNMGYKNFFEQKKRKNQ